MFTVIICDKAIIKDCTEKYKIHFNQLLKNKELAFCKWNTKGETLEEALPELNGLIKSKEEWRAVVVYDSHVVPQETVLKTNPFDFVDSKRMSKQFDKNPQEVHKYRNYVKTATEKALENPLLKLSLWLNGYPSSIRPFVIEENVLQTIEPFSDEYQSILEKNDISAEDLEISLARALKYDTIESHNMLKSEMFYPPKIVIAIAERANDIDLIKASAVWKTHLDSEYSKFSEDNLYSARLRFLVYQLPRIKGNIRELDYFQFLTTLLIFSENEISLDEFKQGKLYELKSEIDHDKVKIICNNYIYKLNETLKKIKIMHARKKISDSRKLDDNYAMKEFESETTIPVKMIDGYKKDSLMCSYKGVGLSTDCPTNEYFLWNSQYPKIKKHFLRFLRQPHRSIKNSVNGDFKNLNYTDNLDAKLLNEYQKEDVVYKLLEEEEEMVEVETSNIFDTNKYNEMMDKADKDIKQGVSQRMTRKKTIVLGTILLLLFIVGFIPLLISEFNNLGTGVFSLALVGTSLSVLVIAMFMCLLYLRKKLIDKFKHFNEVMSNIYDEIINSLDKFSDYLSHTCRVMREFSVLNMINDKSDIYSNTYKKHEIEIGRNIEKIMHLFPEYIESEFCPTDEIMPYDYDFDLRCSYEYNIPYTSYLNEIEFLHTGVKVLSPVDYIKRISVTREELYD